MIQRDKPASSSFTTDILEEHVESLGFLWGQWCAAIRSPDYTLREIGDLEDRIDAHVAGTVAVGEPGVPILMDVLTEQDRFTAFAAAYALLHTAGESGASTVLQEFSVAEGDRLLGLAEAMSYGPLQDGIPEVQKLFETASPLIAAAAAEVLAFHGALKPTIAQINGFLFHDDEEVRHRGWRLVGHLCYPVDPQTYSAALKEAEPAIKRAVLESGAWCRVGEVTALLRAAFEEPSPESYDELYVQAVLGDPDDLPGMREIVELVSMGPDRYRLAGAYGHPALMPSVIDGLADPDPTTAAAAGTAFLKVTGVDVWSDQRLSVGLFGEDEADEFEAHFADEVFVPDPKRAEAAWEKLAPHFSNVTRVVRGHDMRSGLNDPAFAKLDMESRWEVCLRSKFTGLWSGSPLGLDVFPQRR